MKSNTNILDLSPLVEYFDKLREIMDRVLPRIEDIPWEASSGIGEPQKVLPTDFPMPFIDYKHPDWIRSYFPMNGIFYRKKVGKIRKCKNPKTADQNNNSVATCVICSAEDYGIITRKLKHRGYPNLIGSLPVRDIDIDFQYAEMVIPKRFKNFSELYRCHTPEDIELKAIGEVLDKHYPCNATGQLRLI
jgi:hypothetical protein